MRLEKVREALEKKKIRYDYHEEDGCGSVDFLFRGLPYHVWEFCDDGVWGCESNVFIADRTKEIEGDYEQIISDEILKWPDMLF